MIRYSVMKQDYFKNLDEIAKLEGKKEEKLDYMRSNDLTPAEKKKYNKDIASIDGNLKRLNISTSNFEKYDENRSRKIRNGFIAGAMTVITAAGIYLGTLFGPRNYVYNEGDNVNNSSSSQESNTTNNYNSQAKKEGKDCDSKQKPLEDRFGPVYTSAATKGDENNKEYNNKTISELEQIAKEINPNVDLHDKIFEVYEASDVHGERQIFFNPTLTNGQYEGNLHLKKIHNTYEDVDEQGCKFSIERWGYELSVDEKESGDLVQKVKDKDGKDMKVSLADIITMLDLENGQLAFIFPESCYVCNSNNADQNFIVAYSLNKQGLIDFCKDITFWDIKNLKDDSVLRHYYKITKTQLDYTSPPTDCTSPPTDCTSPPTDCTSPPTDCTSPPTDCTSPPTDCTSPPTDCTSPPTSDSAPGNITQNTDTGDTCGPNPNTNTF